MSRPASSIGMAVTAIVAATLAAGCGSPPGPSPTPPASTLVSTAISEESQHQWSQAEAHLVQAIQADPRNKQAYFYLGFAEQETGSNGPAEKDYRSALILDPDYQDALFNLATLRAAPSPYEAIELYYHVIELNANYAEAHLNLGFALRSVGQTTQGNAEISKAIQLKPSLGNAGPTATPTPTPS